MYKNMFDVKRINLLLLFSIIIIFGKFKVKTNKYKNIREVKKMESIANKFDFFSKIVI